MNAIDEHGPGVAAKYARRAKEERDLIGKAITEAGANRDSKKQEDDAVKKIPDANRKAEPSKPKSSDMMESLKKAATKTVKAGSSVASKLGKLGAGADVVGTAIEMQKIKDAGGGWFKSAKPKKPEDA